MKKENVCVRARQSVSKTDIIAINGMAKADAAKGNRVINASIGTFLDDSLKVGGISLIEKNLKEHITDVMGYPSVYGNPDYLDACMNLIFGDAREAIEGQYRTFIGATLGGTGALSIAFNLFTDEGEEVLLPNVMWTNYTLIARKAGCRYRTYRDFTEKGTLDIASIEQAIRDSFREHEHVLFVLNDPCQNPTGYCLSPEEYDEIFEVFNRCGRLGQLTVIFDIAYMAFYHVEGETCNLIQKLREGHLEFLPAICFSCSKIFGMYGLRCGALVTLSEEDADRDEIARAFGAQARGTYSVPVGTAQAAISNALKDPVKMKEIFREIDANAMVVYRRGQAVLRECAANGIGHFPYKCGFFISLKVPHAFEVFEAMKERHMYIVPMSESTVRLALCGVTEEDAVTLIRNLAEVMAEIR